jgi:asparagine synthase (glutamine-hydrolysing)
MGVHEARNTVFAAAGRAGIRTLLTGDIGDACVYGSRMVFDSLLRKGNVRKFLQHVRAYRRVSDESLLKIAAIDCLAPFLPLSMHKRVVQTYLRRAIRGLEPYLLPSWMPESLRSELGADHLRLTVEVEQGRRFSNDTREAEYRLLYPPEIARSVGPWPIEIRRPFADRRLHEFLLAIPPEQKFEPHPDTDEYYAGSKQIVRRAMRGILPETVRTRTSKTVFWGVWEQELERQWPTYTAAFGPAARSEIAQRGFVDQKRFWSRLQELRCGSAGPDQVYVFHMLELETWLRSLQQERQNFVRVSTQTQDESAQQRLRTCDARSA